MNVYAVYKVQTRSSLKDKQMKGKIPSPVSSLIDHIVTLFGKIFYCVHNNGKCHY